MSDSTLKHAISALVNRLEIKTQVGSIGPALPPGPFAELLKMVAHTGEIPRCDTCKHGIQKLYLVECRTNTGLFEPKKFCCDWEPQGAIAEAPAGVEVRGYTGI